MTIDPEERKFRQELERIRANIKRVTRIKSEIRFALTMLGGGIFWIMFAISSLIFGFDRGYIFLLFMLMGILNICVSSFCLAESLKKRDALGMTPKEWKEF